MRHPAGPPKPLPPGRSGARRAPLHGVLAVLVLSAGWLPARGEIKINPRGWKFPNIITAAKEVIRISDRTPLVPGKETMLKGYRKADGTRFMTYEIEGRVIGVEIDTDGKPPFEYSIMDADGDGKFETRIDNSKDNTDHAYVPQWAIDHYYAMHPELKDPSGKGKTPGPTLRSLMPPPAPTPTPPPKVGPPPAATRDLPTP